MAAAKKHDPKSVSEAQAEGTSQLRMAALRTFRVRFDDSRPDEIVMAHNVSFPHPREATFSDIQVEGNMILQYMRRAIFNWVEIVEETPASDGTARVQ